MILPSPSWKRPPYPIAATETTLWSCCTVTGLFLSSWVPSPSWPAVFWPMARTVPSPRRMYVCQAPMATWMAFAMPGILAGTVCLSVDPIPSSPFVFAPSPITVPSAMRKTVEALPTAACFTRAPAKPWICQGLVGSTLLTSPSCPCALLPVPQTVPSAFTKTVCLAEGPTATSTTESRSTTFTGTVRTSVVPSPSCQLSFLPAAMTVPSCSRKTVWRLRQATCATPETPVGRTGRVNWSWVWASPSCP
mmetsp:Transcript_88412/g.274855  ORF Transcript_88412/g.274855 Transcript_88412/m.274855 type:complete len:249 (+) Transcript_88412:292-1038(+)